MLLDAVIIILSEVLEASFIISFLLASNRLLGQTQRWIVPAIGAGVVFSLLLAWQFERLSEMFDGAGQEFVLCGLIVATMACLLWRIAELLFAPLRRWQRLSLIVLGLTVVFAVSREGAEIFIYGYAFAARAQTRIHLILGGAIGAGIGVSVGVLCYYALMQLQPRFRVPTLVSVLALIAAGMSVQAVMNLMQAGALESQAPLWNSSWLVHEASIPGQLLYALFGYESTPTLFQALAYVVIIAAVFSMLVVKALLARRR